MGNRTLVIQRHNADGSAYRFIVHGAPRLGWQDLYHALLTVPTWVAIGGIVGAYLALNALFALAYMEVGGVTNVQPGSFSDAFFFSVQTMGTIGYGAMYPASALANTLVVAESVLGMLITALATGLVFVRFSMTRPRLAWSRRVGIAPIDGVPSLMIRVGNERGNQIRDAQFRLMLTRTTRTLEGVTVYRTVDLKLVRDRAPALSRAWNVVHAIDASSPLHGASPESLAAADAEISLTLAGTDETSLQPVHGQATWDHSAIDWGHRLADIVSEPSANEFAIDLRRFHDLVPSQPVEGFPYPRASDGKQVATEPDRAVG